MFKQSPSRNHRSKGGIKAKRSLQICVLLAICFWLIYQVKHSHDKKKAFDENDAKIPFKSYVNDEIVKLGRKDLHPGLGEITMKNEKGDEETEEEETGGEEEDEDNKHEEEEQEGDSKTEEREDDGRGGGDDEIDERDQEKSEMEVEREEDFLEEEKERVVDEEAEDIAAEDKEGQNENETSLDGHDHDGGNHEAREEQYRADDASSAVTHETEGISNENERGSLESSNDNVEMKIREENKVNNAEETAGEEEKGDRILSFKSDGSSVLNSKLTTESNNQAELGSNSPQAHLEATKLSLSNGTKSQNASGHENNSYPASNNNPSDSNLTISGNTENVEVAMGSSNSSTTSELAASEKVITVKNTDASQNEKSDTRSGSEKTRESSGSYSKTENADEVLHDPIDSSESSVHLVEKDARKDLDTLPKIRTEGSNNEGTAAE
ncbi:hypothetical protein U1Q18_004086 [Sarracenia purpurea var. burkii]